MTWACYKPPWKKDEEEGGVSGLIWAKAGKKGGSPGPASLELLWPWLAAKDQIEHHVSNRLSNRP